MIDAGADFYDRWAAEMEDNPEGLPVVTYHYFPNLDRIRVRLALTEYPRPAEVTEAVRFTENVACHTTGVIEAQTLDGEVRDHRIVLFWQTGYTAYLRDEYELGTPLWIYCSYYSVDHANRILIVFVREFASVPDETVVDNRIGSYRSRGSDQ